MNRSWLILLVLPFAGVACDRAWQAYEQIELGRPLPKDNVLVTEGEVEGHVRSWDEKALILFPYSAGGARVRARTDAVGNVTAKSYSAAAYGHWLAFQTGAMRSVAEIIVPEQFYCAPPAEGLAEAWTTYKPPEEPTNALEYIMRVRFDWDEPQFGLSRDGQHLVPFSFSMSALWGMDATDALPDIKDLLGQTKALVGMTQEGFDRTFRNTYGGTLRVRNLGGRRLRFEGRTFEILDPLMVVMVVNGRRDSQLRADGQPVLTVVGSASGPGPSE